MKRFLTIALAALLGACSGSSNQDGSATGDGTGNPPTPQPLQRDCTWLVNSDPDVANIFFPDTAANYWLGAFVIPEGGAVKIEGNFPHARYMSFNLYDPTLAPIDSLTDFQIEPDAGSVNPFRPGADRDAQHRSYTVQAIPQPAPSDPAKRSPNTLYTGIDGVAVPAGIIVYRIYVPDLGTSLSGNEDLPRFHYILAGGAEMSSPDACSFLERTRLGLGVNQLLTSLDLSALPIPIFYTNPITWHRFYNPPLTYVESLGNVLGDLPVYQPVRQALQGSGLSGGFLSNRDNAYVAAFVNNSLGEIAVITSRVPTTPRTYDNESSMQSGQLRYLSLCTNDFATQRYWDCKYDEQMPRDSTGNYTVVISHADKRPANARPECGVAWLNWGPLAYSALILRNMLPGAAFDQAIQNVNKLDTEQQVMGPYYPYTTYSTQAEFESLSADPKGDASTCIVNDAPLRARAQAGH